MKRLVGFVLTAVVVAVPGVAVAQEGGLDYTNTVTVAAGSKVEMESDVARIHFGVRGASKDAAAATRRAAAKTESVLDSLRNAGVTQDELTVGGVRLDRRTDRKRNFLGYVASVSVKVETEQLDLVGEFIDAAVVAGATSVRGLEYDVQDRSAGVDQALREAMAFARAKAEALAESAGREVGLAIVISEYDSRPPRAVAFDTAARSGGGSGEESGALAATIPVVPPTLTAQARITVTFELI